MVQKAPLGALLQHIAYPALAKFPRLQHRFFGNCQIFGLGSFIIWLTFNDPIQRKAFCKAALDAAVFILNPNKAV